MSENTDDLEQTLMLAAAAADSRQYEESSEETQEDNEPNDLHYYTEASVSESTKVLSNSRGKVALEDSTYEPKEKVLQTEHISESRTVNNRGIIRKHEEIEESQTADGSHTQVVATHYNLIEEKGLDERSKSRIVYLRNFHNWIKSMLINEYLTKIRNSKKQHNPPIRVHDMCCGKGGDLLKWKKGNITHLICSDIAEVSLEHCKQRYTDMKQRTRNERGGGNLYSLEVIPGDSTKQRLRERYSDPSLKLDLVSCQFAFHYSFESLPQAECMMRNASECLQPGGFFIGTMPDSNEIIARARKTETDSFGNNVYQVSVDFDVMKPPLFGSKYNFQLDGVVNCPEFLVHFPTFVKLAKKYGLKLVKVEKFWQFFERMKSEGKQLLSAMKALEGYPPPYGVNLVGDSEDDYLHAKQFIEKEERGHVKIGTLSKSEWEVSSLYLTFVFEKVKNTWNADGTK